MVVNNNEVNGGSLSVHRLVVMLLTVAGCVTSPAWSQSSRLPGVVDQPQEGTPSIIEEPKATMPAPAQQEFTPPVNPNQVIASIRDVTFSGDLVLDVEDLKAVAKPYLGRDLTNYDLAKLKFDLTALYFREGYPLVKVVTPPQDISKGVLSVRIYMGHLGKVERKGNGRLDPRVVSAFSNKLQTGSVFNEKTAETVLQDLNDLPNLSARLSLQAGEKVGTSDVHLFIDEADEDRQNIYLDNYGSELTGNWVLTGDFHKSNLLGFGESFGLTLRKSNEDLKSIAFSALRHWRYMI